MRYFWILLFLTSNLTAQTFTWNGAGDKVSWSDANNWSGGVVPGGLITHEVIINDASQAVNLDINVNIGKLEIIGSTFNVLPGISLGVFNQAAAAVDTVHGIELRNANFTLSGNILQNMQGDDHALGIYSSTFTATSGSIYKTQTPEKGILIKSGTATFKSGSTIDCKTTKQAIENWSFFDSQAKAVFQVGEEGIFNYGTMVIADSLEMTTTGSNRFHSIYNEGSFTSYGYLSLEGARKHSIKNHGVFQNQGSISLKTLGTFTPVTSSSTVYNDSLFTNDGVVFILSLLHDNLNNVQSSSGFVNNGTWISSGAINYGIVNAGSASDSSKIINTGTIDVSKGLQNLDYSSFINEGSCSISTIGLLNAGIFESSDSLFIDDINTAIENQSTMSLDGVVHISNGEMGVLNTGELHLLSNCDLQTSGLLGPNSYHIKNTGTLTNEGSMKHINGLKGILNEEGVFNNTGNLELRGLSEVHLFNNGTDSSIFNNTGQIYLSNCASDTDSIIYNGTKGRISNNGSLSVDSMYYDGQLIVNLGKVENWGSLNTNEVQAIVLNNSGEWYSNTLSSLNIDFSQNLSEKVIINTGDIELDGVSNIVYDDALSKNDPCIENNGNFTIHGTMSFDSGKAADFLENSGTFTLIDTLKLIDSKSGITNSNSFIINGYFESNSGGITSESITTNNGTIKFLAGGGGITIKENGSFTNHGSIEHQGGFQKTILLEHSTSVFTNATTGRIEYNNSTNLGSITDGVVQIENGSFTNQGFIKISNSEPVALNMVSGTFLNEDSLLIQFSDAQEMVRQEAGTFTNSGYLQLDGTNKSNVTLYFLFTSALFNNSGSIHIIDANQRGIYRQGQFFSNVGSSIIFENNNRSGALPFTDANSSQPIINYGDMLSINSSSCINLVGLAENHGFLDLNTCGISMISGTNKAAGYIRSKDLSFVNLNEGTMEFIGDELYHITGTNVITNEGVIVDINDSFRNISFNDGGALGFPIWNKGLFVNPFYGTLSNGIKEVMNLNFTESGTLPISTAWYTDRSLTVEAGTWEQNLHYFTPNENTNTADSIFFEVSLGGISRVLAIPHHILSSCPSPQKLINTQPSAIYDWSKHTTWRGNRIPNLCDKGVLNGQQNVLIPSGFHIRVNEFEYAPGLGNNRYVDIESGAVFETYLLPYD